MKKWIHSYDELNIANIVSIAFVDDASISTPRNAYIYASTELDYSTLTRDQLLELPAKVRNNIHDINILRKLNKAELTLQQQFEVTQANLGKFKLSAHEVETLLVKIKDCDSIYLLPSQKNESFRSEIRERGGKVRDEDVKNIIDTLTVSDYQHSTYSYLDIDWNSLLLVFKFRGSYTFPARNSEGAPVTIESLELYIKIDVDKETDNGYMALSFHRPEFS